MELTLDDLYLQTGISIPKLSRIERHIFRPTKKEKKLIAGVLRASIKKIFPEG